MSEGVTPSPEGTHSGFPSHTHNLLGSLTVTVLGLALLGYALYTANTTIPRIMAAVIVLVGIAVVTRLVPGRAPRDFYGGPPPAHPGTTAFFPPPGPPPPA